MLEIIILFALGKNIAAKAREKGRSGGWFVFLLLGLWFGGEIFGAIAAGLVGMIAMGEQEPPLAMCYLGALAGAAIGAVIAFAIVSGISPAHTYDEDHDDYDYDRRDRSRNRDRDRDRDHDRDRDWT